MSDPKIARTVSEAQAGDLLWICDPQRNRYDANGQYQGRGVWAARTVVEVGRQSLIVENMRFARDTGQMRGNRGGYSGRPFVAGSSERADLWWNSQNNALAKRIQDCRDQETLRTVAVALGMDGPPDFTVSLEPSHDRS